MTTAEALRDEGMAVADSAVDDWWRSTADAGIAHLAASGRPFTADTLRAELGLPEPRSPRALGARFVVAARSGVIVKVGWRPSLRPSVRTSVVALWIGAEHAEKFAA